MFKLVDWHGFILFQDLPNYASPRVVVVRNPGVETPQNPKARTIDIFAIIP
ncbi:unnamed protein product [Brassica oleracea]